MTGTLLLAADDGSSSISPWYFVLAALALIVVSSLGPLSRWHEHRDTLKREREAAAKQAVPPTSEPPL